MPIKFGTSLIIADITYAKKNDKIGFINKKGEWIIEPSYDKARAFVNGLAPVTNDKTMGLY